MSISTGRARRGLPSGPHGLTPEEVAHSQRQRLLIAMTEAVAERGYTATPVAQVIERAGVSRKTFYVHFHDRRDCLVAAYEASVGNTLELARRAAQEAGESSRLSETISALCTAARQSPGGSRLLVAEIAAAGQAELLGREQTILALGELLRDCLIPSAAAPPAPVMGIITGGLLRVIDQHAKEGRLASPQALVRELARWIRSYHPAPATLAELNGHSSAAEALRSRRALIGGRAPGTLSVTARHSADAGRGVSPSFTAHSQRERILDAVTRICAEKGYVALTVDEIVAVAGVSLNTFYDHFTDKEDAFLVAQELGHVRGAAILEQTLAFAPNWDVGVREGIAALLGFFFSEPSFARLAAVEGPIATPQTAARAQHHLASYAQLLLEGAPRNRRPPAIARQAVAAALHEAVFAFGVHGAIRNLARAQGYVTYIALAPFLGPNRVLADKADNAHDAVI